MQNSSKIAVLGAGVMGLMSAYALQRAGHHVALFDPAGFPANNASYKAGGMLAPYSEIEHMPMPYIEAGFESIEIWEYLVPALGYEIDFKRSGSLFISHPEDQYLLERFWGHLQHHSQCIKVDMKQIAALEPSLPGHFRSGIFIENEAYINPADIMDALCSELKHRKSVACEINDLQDKFDFIVDCRGIAAQKDDPELRGVKGELLVVENPDFTLNRPLRLMHPRYPLYIVPRAGGQFMIGATNIESAEDKRPSLRSAMELMSALYSLHPSFGDAKIIAIESDIRPSYPDNLPQIKRAGNVIACNGMFRHGFLLSPVMAECVKAMVQDQDYKYRSIFERNEDEDYHQRAA